MHLWQAKLNLQIYSSAEKDVLDKNSTIEDQWNYSWTMDCFDSKQALSLIFIIRKTILLDFVYQISISNLPIMLSEKEKRCQ